MIFKSLKIAACILCAIALTVLAVAGLYFGIRNARAVVKLEDIILDSGTVTYLASVYNMSYEGEDFEADFKEEVKDLVAQAYLYSVHFGYTPEDKIAVIGMSESVLKEKAHGSVTEFNEMAEDHGFGFDYNDFQNANALKYKADKAKTLMAERFGSEEYEKMLNEARDRVDFNRFYNLIDLTEIAEHEYYVK